jgi:predicted regulator of Ras-like GTPase activity (Roadblock/LC7/MglB family)
MELLLTAMESIDVDAAGGELGEATIRKEMEAFEENLRRELETSGVDLYEERADQNVARRLRRVPGVQGAVLVARDGTVVADDFEGDAEKEAAVAVFVGNAASEIGESLALGNLERGSVQVGEDRMLVLEQAKYFAGLVLEDRASPELVHAEARKLLS